MNLKEYIKDKLSFISANLLLLFLVLIIQYIYHIPVSTSVLMIIVWILPLSFYFAHDYYKKRDFYCNLLDSFQELDQKYLLQNIIREPEFLEGKLIYEILYGTNKSVHEEINDYKRKNQELTEFIELWIHEIKTPIAAAKLIIQNNNTPNELNDELFYIENYVEQVLYYARSKEVYKDYVIHPTEIDKLVKSSIQKYAKILIYNKVKIKLENCSGTVSTDSKWVEFILHQIINNSIQYCCNSNPTLYFYTNENETHLILTVEDNGIGIIEKDLPNIFNKGFTGETGRKYKNSTGMGLYICKNLANKLHLGLEVESTVSKGTKVHIIFPKDRQIYFEENQ